MTTRVLIIVTFLIGIGAGLAYAWLIDPVTFTESSPAQVTTAYQQVWLIMAAESFAQDGDWDRAQTRVQALHDPNLSQTIQNTFDRYNTGGPNPIARSLAKLADRLNVRTAEMLVYLATPAATPTLEPTTPARPIATLAATVTPSATPLPDLPPTFTPMPTPIADYQLIGRVSECTNGRAVPQIRVIVQDALGRGVSGKEVWITWEGGADRFFTGLKPEIDPGYGDFDMALDQSYAVGIDKPTSIIVSDLRAEPCEDGGHTSWRLVFGPRVP